LDGFGAGPNVRGATRIRHLRTVGSIGRWGFTKGHIYREGKDGDGEGTLVGRTLKAYIRALEAK